MLAHAQNHIAMPPTVLANLDAAAAGALLTGAVLCVAVAAVWVIPLVVRWHQVRRWRRDGGRVLALTYDDGPDAVTMPAVLDLLRSCGAKATFYLVGFRAEQCPSVIDRAAAEGHELATHTHRHKNAWKIGPWNELRDSLRGYRTLSKWVGPDGAYRPPFGKITLPTWLAMRRRGRRVDWWTVAAGDTRDTFPDPAALAARVLERGGPVVLMHCHHAEPHRRAFVLALTRALAEGAAARGIRLVTMSELEASCR